MCLPSWQNKNLPAAEIDTSDQVIAAAPDIILALLVREKSAGGKNRCPPRMAGYPGGEK